MTRRTTGLPACVVSALLSWFALAHPGSARAQDVDAGPAAAWMTYALERTVDQGTGAYEGYSDVLRAAGRYDLTPTATHLRIVASYRWRYDGDHCETGAVDRQVSARLADGLYEGRTDLDDYDELEGIFATWLWVPPTLGPGDTRRILERDFTVGGVETLVVAGVRVEALRLRASGVGRRDDEYGGFDTTFTDTYWFDASTGYFLRSEYEERDLGESEGVAGSFRWLERVEVAGASYLSGTAPAVTAFEPCGPPTARGPEPTGVLALFGSGFCCLQLIFVLLALLLIGGVIGLLRSRRTPPLRIDGQRVTARRLTSVAQLPAIARDDSPLLHPFLPHLVEQALAADQPVFLAQLERGRVIGLGIADQEAQIGSIFAKDPDACELLRKALGVTELFTEHRHETLPSVVQAVQAAGRFEHPLAYNVLETYDVLANLAPAAVAYDTQLVTRMTDADLPDVAALSALVHGVRGERWLAAALATGELGFVARLDGKLVGYAFATVVGDRGRLHGNTVSPDHRGKGIGRELARARVSTCVALGAGQLLAEVATWNVASLEVMRSLGFEKIGTLWIESAAGVRVERKVLRR